MRELIIDSFAGGGGASTGIEMALGRSPDYAINHDANALAMHRANHPDTVHLSRNIYQVDPIDLVGRRPVGLLWASPDCKHFSKAKGGRPVKRNIRDLAWTVVLWAKRARPRVIILENVEEFQGWGPLIEVEPGTFQPCPDRKGETFRRWISELKRLGYRVEWRELRACDYGAPTTRKRLFVIARRDGQPIVWPDPTHGAPTTPAVVAGKLKPWRTAAEIIDWSLPCPSIFLTKEEGRAVGVNRPLAEATMARIAKGVKRYVLDAARPFIVPVTHTGTPRVHPIDEPVRTVTTAQRGEHAVVVPHVTKFRTNSIGSDVQEPVPTVTANGHASRPGGAAPLGVVAPHLVRVDQTSGDTARESIQGLTTENRRAVVAAFLAQHNAGPTPGAPGRGADEPVSTVTTTGSQQTVVQASLLPHLYTSNTAGGRGDPGEPLKTVTAGDFHAAEVRAFLMKYFGTDQDPRMEEPLHTVTTKDRFGLVTIHGELYQIVDIGMRMLSPRELFAAQGFPPDYEIEFGVYDDGERRRMTKTVQVEKCGNSVCPPLARALVAANCADLAMRQEAAE